MLIQEVNGAYEEQDERTIIKIENKVQCKYGCKR